MVSPENLQLYNQVRSKFCFFLDIQDNGLARSLSRRIQDMGLQQECVLSARVTHVVRDACAARARGGARGGAGGGPERRARLDAMLRRATSHSAPAPHSYVLLTVQKAITLLDKLYDSFCAATRKQQIRLFTKHYIKIEFLDKLCRPIFKEFDEWPEINLDPNPPKSKIEKQETTETPNYNNSNKTTVEQKMTRKNRPRINNKEDKEPKAGYCEMCNTDYGDVSQHLRSSQHLSFAKDNANFLGLDSLIEAGADVTTFLEKTTPINGERRSLRKMCNGEIEQPKNKRSKRSQSPDSTVNGDQSPARNGLDDDRKPNTRCNKKSSDTQTSEDRQYYKVVSTKLRSSGGFVAKKKDTSPTCNGKPLVVKFKKIRKSELSVLSDEAEQFMFPKRASSTSSTSSDDEEVVTKQKKSPTPPPLMLERRRLARPLAFKEESSEEDSWPDNTRRRKRRAPPATKRSRRIINKPPLIEAPLEPESQPLELTTEPAPEQEEVEAGPPVSPLREEQKERCMKWEDGQLKYTPAVEQLEFAFESVPLSEPWFETFRRQDQDKVAVKNVARYFSLFSNTKGKPKLPYEIGQLPPLKPNCCPLSDLVKTEPKAGPSRLYGTRGMKKQRCRKRTAQVIALDGHPRKSPREHASTLAILGSAGLLHRRRLADDTKSTASEDTLSETLSNVKVESTLSEEQEASERLQQFLAEVYEEDEDEVDADDIGGEPLHSPLAPQPDVLSLVSECDNCDIIRKEISENVAQQPRGRRGRLKKNKTGWPRKRKNKKPSWNSSDSQKMEESERSSDERSAPPSEEDNISEEESQEKSLPCDESTKDDSSGPCDDSTKDDSSGSDDKPLKPKQQTEKESSNESSKASSSKDSSKESSSETDGEAAGRRSRRSTASVLSGLLLQPVVRVARVDPAAARRLRSAASPPARGRGRARARR